MLLPLQLNGLNLDSGTVVVVAPDTNAGGPDPDRFMFRGVTKADDDEVFRLFVEAFLETRY